MNITITINSEDLDELERFERLVNAIKLHNRELDKHHYSISDLKTGIETLEEIRDEQLEKIKEVSLIRKDLQKLRTEVQETIKANAEIIEETMNETLNRIGLKRSFIEDKIIDIEKATGFRRRDGYFKSSEQSTVYDKLNDIKEYLEKFPDVTNRALEDFSDIHVKKLFNTDFDEIRSSLNDFKLSESAQNELDAMKNEDSDQEPEIETEQKRKTVYKP